MIPNLSKKVENLQKKLKEIQQKYKMDNLGEQPRRWNTDKIPIQLTESEKQEMKLIKNNATTQIILYYPKIEDSIILQTDASELFWSGVIFAKTKKENEILAYTSGKFAKPEIKYSAYDKELLAIKKSIKSFKIYLLSREFIIETDNKAVVNFLKIKRKTFHNPEENIRRIRLAMYFEIFQYEVRYISGYTNVIADFLSRQENDR